MITEKEEKSLIYFLFKKKGDGKVFNHLFEIIFP